MSDKLEPDLRYVPPGGRPPQWLVWLAIAILIAGIVAFGLWLRYLEIQFFTAL